MNQLYWQVYKNLERDFINLADVIHINDKQQDVYSMKIADLLIRTVVEIEALAKELYLSNGGDSTLPDKEMYFDTVCIAHLDNRWKICRKKVMVVSPVLYFEQEENKILTPLHKANERGTSSAIWNRAYQAVKHNRVKELQKGSIKNLLGALAALYVLNLYYLDEHYDSVNDEFVSSLDNSFGSSLFAVKIHKASGLKPDGSYEIKVDYDECVFISDYESESKQAALDSLNSFEKAITSLTIDELKVRLLKGLQTGEIANATNQAVHEIKDDITTNGNVFRMAANKLGKELFMAFSSLRHNVKLNKCQYSQAIEP